MNEKLYYDHFQKKSFDEVVAFFHETIIDTNRGFKFFVDWNKIKEHVSRYKIELNILNTLIGSKTFDKDLCTILTKYPEVLPVIPILVAVRDQKLKVIRDFMDNQQDYAEFDFTERNLKENDLKSFVEFFEKTGLKNFFETLSSKSIQDYVTGIEVGMDTHARKNRSGDAMELAIKPIVDQIIQKHSDNFLCLFQQKFKKLSGYGVRVPTPLEERKADFLIVKNSAKVINIEVNFYSGTGSKPQEIVDSYINRQKELEEYGLNFIWITDGYGWRGQKNQIAKGFMMVHYLLNLHFCRKGLLEKIFCQI
jgi:type II restriction enzyme